MSDGPAQRSLRATSTLRQHFEIPSTSALVHPFGVPGVPRPFERMYPAPDLTLLDRSGFDPAQDPNPADEPESRHTRAEKIKVPPNNLHTLGLRHEHAPTLRLPDPITVDDQARLEYPPVQTPCFPCIGRAAVQHQDVFCTVRGDGIPCDECVRSRHLPCSFTWTPGEYSKYVSTIVGSHSPMDLQSTYPTVLYFYKLTLPLGLRNSLYTIFELERSTALFYGLFLAQLRLRDHERARFHAETSR